MSNLQLQLYLSGIFGQLRLRHNSPISCSSQILRQCCPTFATFGDSHFQCGNKGIFKIGFICIKMPHFSKFYQYLTIVATVRFRSVTINVATRRISLFSTLLFVLKVVKKRSKNHHSYTVTDRFTSDTHSVICFT